MLDNEYPVTAVGNGHALVYRNYNDLISVRLWSCSAPILFSASFSRSASVKDAMPKGECAYYREVNGECRFTIRFPDYVRITDRIEKKGVITLSLEIPSGTYAYGNYPVPRPLFASLILKSGADVTADLSGRELFVSGSDITLVAVGGGELPECVMNAEKALDTPFEKVYGEYSELLNEYTSKINIRIKGEYEDEVKSIARSCITAVKTQQDSSGGVSAGYPYCLGYVRDQFGVVKGLLALCDTESAVAVSEFFLSSYIGNGRIHNAYGMKMPSVAHVHENDSAEITGYLLLMIADIAARLDGAKREKYIRRMLPLAEACIDFGRAEIKNGMIPFNGDETYIAGGILPRNTIYDGSSEATLLFIEGIDRFINAAETSGIALNGLGERAKEASDECKRSYRRNFIIDGELITNQPARADISEMPRFRHGVCEDCSSFGWTEKSEKGRFLCSSCQKAHKEGKPEADNIRRIYRLSSVSLLPSFINSSFLEPKEYSKGVISLARAFLETGSLPTYENSVRKTGYDTGFLLIAVTELLKSGEFEEKDEAMLIEAKKRLIRALMDMRDITGTYCEYYDAGKPTGTQYRPWESMINVYALINATGDI